MEDTNNRERKKLTEAHKYYLTPGSTVILQKLRVSQLVTQLPGIYATEISAPCS
jgi:hypothetical protein